MGVSDDGSDVVGNTYGPDPNAPFGPSSTQAFRWTETSGIVGLGYLPGRTSSIAFDASGDGSAVVGYSIFGSGFPGESDEAFRPD